ncbi:LOW QUALITY PROTEIN: dnaJ homolog subfamily B member 7 [Glossophaga mutica]
MLDHHEVLGVQRYPSRADLKKAYHKVALKGHPDKNPANKEAKRKFKVAETYKVLSSDEKWDINKYGKEGLNGEGRIFFDDSFEYGFIFCKPDVFKKLFCKRDLFSFHFFKDSVEDLLNSPISSGSRNRGARCFFSASSEYPVWRFSSYDIRYIPYGSLGHEGINCFSSLAFDDSGMANYTFFTISHKIVNGKNANKQLSRMIKEDEDGGKLKSFLLSCVADKEGFGEVFSSFNNYSPKFHNPKHVFLYTCVENDEQGIPVNSNKIPVFSAGFKEGGNRKQKHEEVQKSTKRNH